ncbi:AAA-ATPase [Quillaja saponaria]|uniref:AAA-ATPase n=1 Tax=Quillaja saponaria TaxID=32244 RepID=A0AAD7PB37_QUISA|nr:AAA-ATPase [Quillaja saponaria]
MEILSQLWSFLGLLTVLQNVLPSQLLSLLHSLYESFQDLVSPYSYFEIPEFNGYCGVDLNDLYRYVSLYLNSVNNPSATGNSCRRLTLSRSKSSNRISFTVAPNQTVHDTFNGHTLSWTHHVDTVQDSLEEKRSFTLRLPKRHRQMLLSAYLDHVTSRAEEFERVSRERRLFTNNGNGNSSYESGWVSVPFRHPSTFETLALEPDLKKQIKEDLTAFSKELTKVSDNSELRSLLIQTTNRSIIVIEDIDCSVDLTADRMSKKTTMMKAKTAAVKRKASLNHSEEERGRVTLSGLLNFTDGLWSCCGEERIIVFTTNYRDNVDPALVRCGRPVGHSLRHRSERYCSETDVMLTVAMREVMSAMQAKMLTGGSGGGGGQWDQTDNEDTVGGRSPESVLMVGSPENWDSLNGKKRKDTHVSTWDKKVKFLVRLKSLTKSDSGRRGA